MLPICGVEGLPICGVGPLSGSSLVVCSDRADGEMPVLHHGECGPFVALRVEYLRRLPLSGTKAIGSSGDDEMRVGVDTKASRRSRAVQALRSVVKSQVSVPCVVSSRMRLPVLPLVPLSDDK